MKEVKWIKIATDIFDDEKILLIEGLPKADSILVIWFKLLSLAGKQNNSGVFILGDNIPYTPKMLATIFRRKESTVKLALQTFEKFGMIEVIDGVITVPNWSKHQNLEKLQSRQEYQKNYQKDYRKKQKVLADINNESLQEDLQESLRKPLRECLRKDDVNTLNKEEEVYREEKEKISDSAESKTHPPAKNPVKHKYGEYNNVLLTDEELEKLKTEFPDYLEKIERLSCYVASSGKAYKSHYATIRNWARSDSTNSSVNSNTKKVNTGIPQGSKQDDLDHLF